MSGVEWILLYLVLGALIGFMAGLLGLGGGGILVPLLSSIFLYQGISANKVVHVALGTSLACMLVSSAASIHAHAARGAVEWRIVRGMPPGIILGTFLTTQLAANVSSAFIALFFALFMALIAVQMFINWQPNPSQTPISFGGLLAAGVGVGSVSALVAVGGCFLTIAYLGYKNVDIKKAIGSSAAIGFPIAVTGTVGYMISGWHDSLSNPYVFGFINVPAFLAISTASAIVAPCGAARSHSLPGNYLKKIFAIISLILSVKMLVSFV
jgi:uncharacterized membrane protein YfcA